MTTLTADLSRLQKERNLLRLTEMQENMEALRDSVHTKQQIKKDCGVMTLKEDREIDTIKANIELVKESIAVVLNQNNHA